MVKQYGQLYLDTRHALLETEDAQTAGMMARQLLCHFSGKSPEAILADRDLYASEQVCRDMSRAVRRLAPPLPSTSPRSAIRRSARPCSDSERHGPSVPKAPETLG